MQIRPVSTFSGLGAAPRAKWLGADSACTAASTSLSEGEQNPVSVQRNADGDTFTPTSGRKLSRDNDAKVRELKARDTEVQAHENAHKAAAGGLARGGPNYEYQTGPDGKRYAVGGDVQIDTAPGRTPEETIAKAQRIRAAGLAPAQPSGQDRAVVAQAAQMESEARAEQAGSSTAGEGSESAGAGRAAGREPAARPRLDLVA